MIKNALQNWKTTSAGVLMIAGSVIHLTFKVRAGHSTEADWYGACVGVLGGIGLIAAGDASQGNNNNNQGGKV